MVVPKVFKSAHECPLRLQFSSGPMSTARPATVPWHSPCAGSVAGARQHPRAAVARKQLGLSLCWCDKPQNTERRALALRPHRVIGCERKLGQGTVSLKTLSVNAQNQIMAAGFVATSLSWYSTRCILCLTGTTGVTSCATCTDSLCRETKRPMSLPFRKSTKTLPIDRQRRQATCIALSKNQRKETCNVLEIMSWKDYNETYIYTSPLRRKIDVGRGAERILRPGKWFAWC